VTNGKIVSPPGGGWEGKISLGGMEYVAQKRDRGKAGCNMAKYWELKELEYWIISLGGHGLKAVKLLNEVENFSIQNACI
jgi:hypothetical protein